MSSEVIGNARLLQSEIGSIEQRQSKNLLSGSDTGEGWNATGATNIAGIFIGDNTFSVTTSGTSIEKKIASPYITFETGAYYTLRFTYKYSRAGSEITDNYNMFMIGTTTKLLENTDVVDEWTVYQYTFTYTGTGYIRIDCDKASDDEELTLLVKDIMLVKGDQIYGGWVPEDIRITE